MVCAEPLCEWFINLFSELAYKLYDGNILMRVLCFGLRTGIRIEVLIELSDRVHLLWYGYSNGFVHALIDLSYWHCGNI